MLKTKITLKKFIISFFLIGSLFLVNSFFIGGNGIDIFNDNALAKTATPSQPGASTPSTDGTTPAGQQDDSMESFAKTLETLLRMIYVILWPLIWIAGKSLDNDLVYGGAIHLDKYLWMFWNIMKNFANYIMGFVFIVSILMYFFTNGKGGKHAWNAHPKDVIKKLLIGSIAIQASWFLMGALIDVSTILTYSVGAMPLNILKADALGSKPVLIPDITWNAKGGSGDQFSVKYSCGQKTMVQCAFSGMEFDPPTFDALRSKIPGAASDACVLGGKAYCIDKTTGCEAGLKDLLKSSGGSSIPACKDVTDKTTNSSESPFKDLSLAELKNTGNNGTGNICNSTISSIVDKSKAGMTGPLYTLYASLLNISEFSVTSSSKTAGTLGFQFLLQAMLALALLIPLITLVVVLMMRVVILWVVIGFSPMLFLAHVFSLKFGGDKYNLKNVLTLIFLPAVTVFALSISIIFLSVLQSSSPGSEKNLGSNLYRTLEIRQCQEDGNMCYINLNTKMKTCITQPKRSIGEFIDFIPWLLVNFMGISLMWTIVFAALKTSKLTESVVNNFEKFGSNMAKSAPILPFPGGSWAGISSIPGTLSSVADSKLGGERTDAQNLIKKLFDDSPSNSGSGSSGGASGGASGGTIPSAASQIGLTTHSNPTDWAREIESKAGMTSGSLTPNTVNDAQIKNIIDRKVKAEDLSRARLGALGSEYNSVEKILQAVGRAGATEIRQNEIYFDTSSKTLYVKSDGTIKRFENIGTDENGIRTMINLANNKNNVLGAYVTKISKSDFEKFGSPYKDHVKEEGLELKYK